MDGSLKWKYTTGNSIHFSDRHWARMGRSISRLDDGNIYALSPANGALKWQYNTGCGIDSLPAVGADGTIYVGDYKMDTCMRSTRRTAR